MEADAAKIPAIGIDEPAIRWKSLLQTGGFVLD
jgi:hypothetical protein